MQQIQDFYKWYTTKIKGRYITNKELDNIIYEFKN
jgi:hypothetical protein